MKRMGWKVTSRNVKRKRVHKYVLSGEEVLADKGLIAGDRIPIAPYYGNRAYVDGVERFEGYVQTKMDVQRLYNMAVSKLAETSAQAPRDIPIFAAQQMPPHLANLWKRQVVERHAYALVEPLIDPVGASHQRRADRQGRSAANRRLNGRRHPDCAQRPDRRPAGRKRGGEGEHVGRCAGVRRNPG
jgi:hypothetical protein